MSYIASISYGKDSLKMLDVIYTRGLPLDQIITFDVWATDTIKAEFPEVTVFKEKMDLYIKQKYGIEVEHNYAKDKDGSKLTYEKCFYKVFESGDNKGRIYGWPFQRGPWCQSRIKTGAKTGVLKSSDIEYIGIAFDEKNRHNQLSNRLIAPLVDFQIDEDLCGLYCKYSGMLSPTYDSSFRDGCWFCHNQGVDQLRLLRQKHQELWEIMLKWDIDSPVTFKADGRTIHDYDKRFRLEDEGLIDPDMPFRWKMLYEDLQYRIIF